MNLLSPQEPQQYSVCQVIMALFVFKSFFAYLFSCTALQWRKEEKGSEGLGRNSIYWEVNYAQGFSSKS